MSASGSAAATPSTATPPSGAAGIVGDLPVGSSRGHGLTEALGRGGGALLAAAFGATARIRGTRALHPVGVCGHGRLSVTPGPPNGVVMLDDPGPHDCVLRWSRATGRQQGLDVEGLALRVDGPGQGDVLLASTGTGVLGRHLLRVRTPHRHGPLTTLLPLQSARGPLLLALDPEAHEDEDPPSEPIPGVGTGANLAHYGPDVDLTAIDPSARMLEETRRKLSEAGPASRSDRASSPGPELSLVRPVRLLAADVGDLPFEDGSFDSVVATYVLCCVPDVPLALTEITRVLRPGGQLLLADHVRSTAWPLRLGQRLLDVATVPLQGEHFSRRPRTLLAAAGLLDILSSDYVPFSLLQAAFALAESGRTDLPGAIRMVSANPARAARLSDRGEIASGLRADLVRVRGADGLPPVVAGVWREGQRIA